MPVVHLPQKKAAFIAVAVTVVLGIPSALSFCGCGLLVNGSALKVLNGLLDRRIDTFHEQDPVQFTPCVERTTLS